MKNQSSHVYDNLQDEIWRLAVASQQTVSIHTGCYNFKLNTYTRRRHRPHKQKLGTIFPRALLFRDINHFHYNFPDGFTQHF